MSDKSKTSKKEQSKDSKEVEENTLPEEYEYASFVRSDEELEFYKTPYIKKEHLFVILVSGFFLVLLCVFAVFNTLGILNKVQPVEIIYSRTADIGIYDPSIAYDHKKEVFWLAYSSIQPRNDNQKFDIDINIAYRHKDGKRWQYSGSVFTGKKDLLDSVNGNTSDIEGVWRYETPTLVYDPDDKGREWKIFAYKYFWTGNVDDARKYSTIVMKTSSDISDSYKWSNEEWLFSARPGQPPLPYGRLVLLHLNRLNPTLSDVSYYAEPAAIYYGGALLMAFSIYRNENKPDGIIMIGSQDHGNSWLYLGTLFTSEEAKNYGSYNRVDAANFAVKDGKLYLMVSFGNDVVKHIGTHIFEFENFAKAKLKSDKNGYPIAVNYIEPPFLDSLTPLGGGSSAYHEKLPSGILMSQRVMSGSNKNFFIYKTKSDLLNKK